MLRGYESIHTKIIFAFGSARITANPPSVLRLVGPRLSNYGKSF